MFKKFSSILFLSFFFLLSVDVYAFSYEQKIQEYIVDITVNEDASIDVQEKILMDFADLERHGIMRAIPYAYGEASEYTELALEVLDVTDENGESYEYEVYDEYPYWELKIGDPDEPISGQHWYYVSYHVDDVISSYDFHDELYWNVTGDQWIFPIESVEVFLTLPDNASLTSDFLDCYTGSYYSTQKDCSYEDLGNNQYYFYKPTFSNIRDNLTILA